MIYQNELENACSQRDIAYGDFKNLPRKASSKIWSNKGFDIATNLEYDRYQ